MCVLWIFWVCIYVIWVLVAYGWFSVHVYLHLLLHHDRDRGGDWWGQGSEEMYGLTDPCRARWKIQPMYCLPFCFTGSNALYTFFLTLSCYKDKNIVISVTSYHSFVSASLIQCYQALTKVESFIFIKTPVAAFCMCWGLRTQYQSSLNKLIDLHGEFLII